ncbi:hypothetical protein OS493_006473 [Desmophyllum pertusum]|uniref:Uncharacterized protein n=1 Tax=Desmophyllum pertusum TaxID=174260 RepID=A0A9X0DBF2_9CNID|nr:hypothetical protein OS493_006473 [Desmophyllum pertusum]
MADLKSSWQGRPFGFEVECVTADGEPTQRGRSIAAGDSWNQSWFLVENHADGTENELDTIMTPIWV